MMAAVNAYRATLGLPALPASQIDSNTLYRFDIRGSKAINLGGGRRVELIGQVFNLFGRTNLGGVGSQYQSNAALRRSDRFSPRRHGSREKSRFGSSGKRSV
jgi:hypothetical protein